MMLRRPLSAFHGADLGGRSLVVNEANQSRRLPAGAGQGRGRRSEPRW